MTRDGQTARKLAGVPWLAGGALPKLLAVLDGDGEEARVVGGAVRNALLDLPSHEIDVATTALPEEVKRRVTAAGYKAVPTGIEHGTITVVVGNAPFEVTTLRQDVETYGRHAKVEFGRDWRADAERRDFTINAFSVAPDGTVYDYCWRVSPISPSAACASSAILRSASRKITCAFYVSSASTPPTAPAIILMRKASPPASPAARGSTSFRASACGKNS